MSKIMEILGCLAKSRIKITLAFNIRKKKKQNKTKTLNIGFFVSSKTGYAHLP